MDVHPLVRPDIVSLEGLLSWGVCVAWECPVPCRECEVLRAEAFDLKGTQA